MKQTVKIKPLDDALLNHIVGGCHDGIAPKINGGPPDDLPQQAIDALASKAPNVGMIEHPDCA